VPLDFSRARSLLQACDLPRLFVNELGWEPCRQKLTLSSGGLNFNFAAVAEKRGFIVWLCESPDGGLPEHETRLKLDRLLAQTSFEHLVVFVTRDRSRHSWMWVRRERGRPISARTHEYSRDQPGNSLLQKLQLLFISLEEEEAGISVTDVSGRARAAFDVERVTKRFYDQFKKEHSAFLKFIKGIEEQADREWYASVMLNRLMFVYFIQRQGFLDGDQNYLRNRLRRCQAEHGKDKFYSFYRYFLLRLFHEGFGSRARTPELEKLLGRIPFLNGGLFDIHELEKPDRYGGEIQIPDKAFEQVFAYFEGFDWVLDPQRTVRKEDDKEEINPDVLGYIFEKYINQKQMGAYYTKEDITDYICKNTIVPFLFDAARAKCKVAFENPNGPTVWDLLKDDPDRYIYPAVRQGISWNYDPQHPNKGEPLEKPLPLPGDIAEGLDAGKPNLIERRKGWNKPARQEFALPTEIWREVVARRQRYDDVKNKLHSGEVRDINDLITLNLDIRQFAQDVIVNCEGPDLLRAFWHAIEHVTILDPTCGSGAFLFAALNILEPLYEACLDRMAAFVEDLERSGEKHRPEKFSDFRKVLERVEAHPNRRYFILKSIILNNLFGVDIMEEAVEICKLRLFLKLAAQVEPDTTRSNLGIEPLPDIDFNIRPGNTLVGYATYDEVKGAITSTLDFDNSMEKISVKAADLQQTFDAFRQRQVEGDGSVPTEHKQEVRQRLKALEDELNGYLAGEYGIKVPSPTGRGTKGEGDAYAKWLKSHQPFHWFVEFYGIMNWGGFDVIIGNPPWKEYAAVRKDYAVKNYSVERSGNLYALCSERSLQLTTPHGYFSFIVQLPMVSSSRMVTLRQCLADESSYLNIIPCDDRPGKLFDGLQHCRACIFVARKRRKGETFQFRATRYNRWASEVRDTLFKNLEFTPVVEERLFQGQFPKLDGPRHTAVFKKLLPFDISPVQRLLSNHSTHHFIFYQEATQYWVKATVGLPHYAKNGKVGAPAHGRHLYFRDDETAHIVCAVLNSSLFYAYFIAYGDCFHLSDTLASSLPLASSISADKSLVTLNEKLMKDLKKHADKKTITTKDGDKISYDEFNVSESKPFIDEIDRVLAAHYGFTDEELDFIINYDIKYRMGRDAENEDE
jgi:hypothetical protein